MRSFFILLISSVVYFVSFGQRVISEIPLSANVNTVQVITVGDSIYLKYGEYFEGSTREKAMWVSPNGKKVHTYHAWDIFEIENFNDTLYYYYFEPTTNLLRAYTFTNSKPLKQPGKIGMQGQVVGSYKEDGLNFITIDRKLKKLIVYKLDKLDIKNQEEFDIPEPLADELKNNLMIEFYSGDAPINSFQGVSKLKLYKYDSIMYLTFDKYVDGSKTNGVKVLRINEGDRTGDFFEVRVPHRDSFRSFLINGNVYVYFNSTKAAHLVEYDLKGVKQNSIITKDSAFNFPVYLRHGSSKTTAKVETFSMLLNKSWGATSMLLSVFSDNAGRLIIQAGSFYNDKGVGVPSASSPIAALLTFAVSTTLKQIFFENPGLKRYYYYEKENINSPITLATDSSNLKQIIDDYEIEQTAKLGKLNFRGYYELDSGILAVYQYRKDKTLRLVHFAN
jgi:hypothetical protein